MNKNRDQHLLISPVYMEGDSLESSIVQWTIPVRLFLLLPRHQDEQMAKYSLDLTDVTDVREPTAAEVTSVTETPNIFPNYSVKKIHLYGEQEVNRPPFVAFRVTKRNLPGELLTYWLLYRVDVM